MAPNPVSHPPSKRCPRPSPRQGVPAAPFPPLPQPSLCELPKKGPKATGAKPKSIAPLSQSFTQPQLGFHAVHLQLVGCPRLTIDKPPLSNPIPGNPTPFPFAFSGHPIIVHPAGLPSNYLAAPPLPAMWCTKGELLTAAPAPASACIHPGALQPEHPCELMGFTLPGAAVPGPCLGACPPFLAHGRSPVITACAAPFATPCVHGAAETTA